MPLQFEPVTPIDVDALNLMDTYNIYSAYPDLPIETMGILLQTFPAVDSKADTLTQSQMLSDHDSTKFIHAQHPKIDGLQRLGIFDVKYISEKPPRHTY